MMKSEFVALLKEVSKNDLLDISHDDYAIIEQVYTYHPAIKDKKQIVELYVNFGMTIINDMKERARLCAEYERDIQQQEALLRKLKDELAELSR